MSYDPQILIVAQAGRLEAEALIFVATACAAGVGPVTIAEVQPGPLWPHDPRLSPEGRRMLLDMGARIVPLHSQHFGARYPHGNKIEALFVLRPGEPFVFFDTDTVIIAPLNAMDWATGTAGAMARVAPTWPRVLPGGPGRRAIWRALYHRFELPAPDPAPYYCAARIHGPCARTLGTHFLRMALSIWHSPPPALAGQALRPWLDQIALPLALSAVGGGAQPDVDRALDQRLTWHYRSLALAYARAPSAALAQIEAALSDPALCALVQRDVEFAKTIRAQTGPEIRHLCRNLRHLGRETPVRKRLKAAGHWDR
ncbi:MAG: hypothetical protein ACPGVS_11030 [Primorskyibacter sp.]